MCPVSYSSAGCGARAGSASSFAIFTLSGRGASLPLAKNGDSVNNTHYPLFFLTREQQLMSFKYIITSFLKYTVIKSM